jgi:hypothetical protein
MPTPKSTPGATLVPLTFGGPGFKGLNTELAGGILPQEWATKLENAVFDETGRPASRKGWTSVTTGAGSGVIKRIFEYYTAAGTSEAIASTDANIYDTLTGTATAIEGTLTITDGNIKFVNFNDKVIGFGIGTGGIPAVRTSGNFADIVVSDGGTAPTGSIGTSAFGRVWGVMADGKTVRYSGLLNETQWHVDSGAGTFDMSKVWPSGQDDIVAIEEFGGDLIIFGSNNTVVLTDGQGSALGIDPLAMYVSDTLPGVGCVSQFAITRAAGDLWFLSYSGIVALKREIVQKSTPFTTVSKNVHSAIVGALAGQGASTDDITLTYNPDKSIVLAIFPATNAQYSFDTRGQLEDGSYRATSWDSDLQTAAYIRGVNNWYGSITGTVGEVHNYRGNLDDTTNFFFDYESGWLDLGAEMNAHLKYIKRMTSFTFVSTNVTVTHKVLYDFSTNTYTFDKAVSAGAQVEYNAHGAPTSGSTVVEYAAFGDAESVEYGGGVSLRTMDANVGGGGQYIKIGLRLDTSGGSFTLQQINLYAKVGRLAS